MISEIQCWYFRYIKAVAWLTLELSFIHSLMLQRTYATSARKRLKNENDTPETP